VKKGGFDWFLRESPDIFCIQETKAEVTQLQASVVKPEGYFSYFDHSKGRKGYSGVAVYTKIEPDRVEYGLNAPEFDQEGRFLALFFNNFVLLNIYFPNGGGGPERLKFKLKYYDLFLEYINSLRKKRYEIIFCGDVNTAHTEIDLARPKENVKNTGFLPIERAWLDKVIASDYVDTFRALNPQVKDIYTYWDMKTFARERNVGWRIDYFFVSKNLLKKVKKVEVFSHVLGSDHCPISLEIDI
jgi:exodeoxyribonuclease-3